MIRLDFTNFKNFFRIASEDAASGGVLAHALQSQPHNQQIIASAAAAIANMATNEKDQVTDLDTIS